MKKVISIVLAIIMAFSVSVTAFAATSTVKAGVKKTVTLTADVEKDYQFTAEEKGIYTIKANVLSEEGIVYATVIRRGNEVAFATLVPDGFYTEWENEELYFCANEGSVFTLDFYAVEDESLPEKVKIEFTVSKFDAPEIQLGKNKTAKDGTVFLFVPEKTGYYNFRSAAASNVDPYISVFDVNGSIDFNHDSGLPGDLNFDLSVKLTKDKVYGIECVPDEFDNSVKKSFNFTVSYNKNIEAEYVDVYDFDYSDDPITSDDNIVLCKGDTEYFYINVAPYGAVPTTEINMFISGNAAYVEQMADDPNEFFVYADRVGKSQVAVLSDNDIGTEINVIVLPRFFGIIRDAFQRVAYFFQAIFNRGDVIDEGEIIMF